MVKLPTHTLFLPPSREPHQLQYADRMLIEFTCLSLVLRLRCLLSNRVYGQLHA